MVTGADPTRGSRLFAAFALGVALSARTVPAAAQPAAEPAAPVPAPPGAPAPAGDGAVERPDEGAAPPDAAAAAQSRTDAAASAVPPLPAAATRPVPEAIALEAGATCLEHDKLVRRVVRWLERDRVDARIGVDVHGSASEPYAVAFTITLGGEQRAERKIRDAPQDCDQLHSALALSIALAIDATLMDAERDDTPGDVPSDEELVADGTRAPSYFRLAVGGFGHATSGVLTDVAPAASLRIELGFAPFLDLRAGAFASRVDGQRLPGVEGRFDVDLIAGRLDGCALTTLAQLRLLACAGAMAGSFRTRGKDFSAESRTDPEPWFALLGGLELQAEITSWLALAVAVDLAVPLQSRTITADGPDGEPLPTSDRKLTAVGVMVGAGPVFRLF